MNLHVSLRNTALAVIGFGLIANAHCQLFLTNGLLAYYPFDGNANDASGNGNDAVPLNVSFSIDRFGSQGKAVYFSGALGTNSAVDCPTLESLPYYPLSYACWFFLTSNLVADVDYPNGAFMTLVGREQSDNGTSGEAFCLASGFVTVSPGGGGLILTNELVLTYPGAAPPVGGFQPYTNVWYQAVLTIDGSGVITLYVNGSPRGTVAANPANLAGIGLVPFRIGASTYNVAVNPTGNLDFPRFSWRGAIDDVRIYNRALSANEVQQLYEYESSPRVTLVRAVKPSFANLALTTNYQLQVSADLTTWTNTGSPFTATNTTIVYPQYWDVDNWNQLFFRLQVVR